MLAAPAPQACSLGGLWRLHAWHGLGFLPTSVRHVVPERSVPRRRNIFEHARPNGLKYQLARVYPSTRWRPVTRWRVCSIFRVEGEGSLGVTDRMWAPWSLALVCWIFACLLLVTDAR